MGDSGHASPPPAPAARADVSTSASAAPAQDDPLAAAAAAGRSLASLAALAALTAPFIAWCASVDRGEAPTVVLGGRAYHVRAGFGLYAALCRVWGGLTGMQRALVAIDRCEDPAEKYAQLLASAEAAARVLVAEDLDDDAVDEWLRGWGFDAGEFMAFLNILVAGWSLRDGLGDYQAGLDPVVTAGGRTYTLRFTTRAIAATLPAAKAANLGYTSEAAFYMAVVRASLAAHHAELLNADKTPEQDARAVVVAIADALGQQGLRRLMRPPQPARPNVEGASLQPPRDVTEATPGTGPSSC
jgi:hypothetical protein